MTNMTLTFDAISESTPGAKWLSRWNRSWPAYEAWFIARGGDHGPSAADSRAALQSHMPELVSVYDKLVALTGGSDRAAKFLSTWCPPAYLGGCSLAAVADAGEVRLVRNYDLSPDLNEGLLLHSAWTERDVMGMVEFLWGLSDGINDAGLSVALAFGGRSETGKGFGVTTILRYILETCETVAQAVAVLRRVPSHMAYNIVIADAAGVTASVELSPGGGAKLMPVAIATNHQSEGPGAERPSFTRTVERHTHLKALGASPVALNGHFLKHPLLQDRYAEGFGTLFTAEYDPKRRSLGLTINGQRLEQSLARFEEGQRVANYGTSTQQDHGQDIDWSLAASIDWAKVAADYASGQGQPIASYLPRAA